MPHHPRVLAFCAGFVATALVPGCSTGRDTIAHPISTLRQDPTRGSCIGCDSAENAPIAAGISMPSRRVLLALSYPGCLPQRRTHPRRSRPDRRTYRPLTNTLRNVAFCAGVRRTDPQSCRQAPSHRRSTSRSRWRRSPGSSGRRPVPHQGATTALPGRHPASQFDDIDKTELCQRCRGDGAHSPGAAVDRQGRVPLGR